jgi:hypothetical protein
MNKIMGALKRTLNAQRVHNDPTGAPLRRSVAMSRHERQATGITARQQRRRRIGPAEFGTRRGLRRYLNTLKRETLAHHAWAKFGGRGLTEKLPNRAEWRFLERWWKKEEEVV